MKNKKGILKNKKASYQTSHSFGNNMKWLYNNVFRKTGALPFITLGIIPSLILSLANIVFIKIIVDCVTNGAELSFLLTAVGVYAAACVILLSANQAIESANIYWAKTRAVLSRALYKKVLTADFSAIDNPKSNEIITVAINQLGNTGRDLCASTVYVKKALLNIFGISAVAVLLGLSNPLIIVICLAASSVTVLLSLYKQRLHDEFVYRSISTFDEILYYNIGAPSDPQSGKDIRIYNMGNLFKETVKQLIGDYIALDKLFTVKDIRMAGILSAVMLLRDGAVFYILTRMCLNGQITTGDFAFYYSAIRIFVTWVSSLETDFLNFQEINYAVDKYRRCIEMPDDDTENCNREIPLKDGYTIEFQNVSFSYDGKVNAVENLSFTASAGEKIAIVGANGAGKTTCIKLLCGLYKPTGGTIRINGIDMAEVDKKGLSDLLTVVFQDAFVLPTSIAKNIALKPEAEIDCKRIYDVLEKAQLKEKIDRLADGIDSMLDREINENAITMSGGETQKMFLARALYKDAPIIILDEPTAALDPIAENEMYLRYNDMTQGKTAFFISHRLASTGFCDTILYFDGGKITERGTHGELMKLDGEYARMYRTQSKYYTEEQEAI